MPKRIAIVGGGLSGLATAYYLSRLDSTAELTVYESSDRLGGVIGTEVIDHPDHGRFVIDMGADMFALQPPAAIELCHDLGVEQRLLVPEPALAGAMIVHRGKLVPIPDGFVLMRATKLWQMMTTPILSWRAKWRFLTERFVSHAPLEENQDVSVAEFVRHRLGQEVLDRLVGPLVAGIYTADVEKLSLKATMAPLLAMVNEHGSLAKATLVRKKSNQDVAERHSAGARYQNFRGFPGGMQELLDLLIEKIDQDSFAINSPVSRIEYAMDSNRWRVETEASRQEFDHVVLASPPAVSARLLGQIEHPEIVENCSVAAQGLTSISAASTAIVVLCMRKDLIADLPDKFGFVVPAVEQRKILAGSFASHKYASRCPVDHTIIRVFVGGALQSELLDRTDEELVDLVRGELQDLIGLNGDPTIQRVVRWNQAMPQYHVGHLTLADQIENALDQIPGLDVATNALRGVGIAPVIGRAKRIAQAIIGA